MGSESLIPNLLPVLKKKVIHAEADSLGNKLSPIR
jgi:hypothetical protein